MKKLLLLLTLSLMLIHCDSKPVDKPKNLIDEEVMVDILYDLQILNALRSSGLAYANQNDISPATYVYQKYKVDSLQFSQSDRYYATDIDDYEKIYQRVTDRLRENKAISDSLLAKNPEVIPDKTSPNLQPVNPKDSIIKQRSIRNRLFKDSIKN